MPHLRSALFVLESGARGSAGEQHSARVTLRRRRPSASPPPRPLDCRRAARRAARPVAATVLERWQLSRRTARLASRCERSVAPAAANRNLPGRLPPATGARRYGCLTCPTAHVA